MLPEPKLPDPKRGDRLDAKGGTLVRRMIRDAKRDAARAERQRVADLEQPDGGMRHGADLGVGLAIERGLVSFDKDALIADEPDSKRGTARRGARAYRVWAPDNMLRSATPSIEQHHHDAAAKYMLDWLIGEQGAHSGPNISGVHVAPWGRWHYNENRAACRQAWRSATKAVGPAFSPVLVWCVLQVTPSPDVPPTVERWAASVGWRTERAVGYLAGALEALALHYGFDRTNSPSAKRARAQRDKRQ